MNIVPLEVDDVGLLNYLHKRLTEERIPYVVEFNRRLMHYAEDTEAIKSIVSEYTNLHQNLASNVTAE